MEKQVARPVNWVGKGLSFRKEQIQAMEELVPDLNKFGRFSQFVQEAIDEKLERIRQEKLQKAS